MSRYFRLACDLVVIGALVATSFYALALVYSTEEPKEDRYSLPQGVQPTLDQDK